MNWLADLMDEYPTKRSETAVERLARVYADVPEDVMQTAVDAYMLREEYFPKVNSLRPYVEQAKQSTVDIEAAHQARLSSLHIQRLRQQLLDSLYAGDFDPAAWKSFATDCAELGMSHNAAWARRRLGVMAS